MRIYKLKAVFCASLTMAIIEFMWRYFSTDRLDNILSEDLTHFGKMILTKRFIFFGIVFWAVAGAIERGRNWVNLTVSFVIYSLLWWLNKLFTWGISARDKEDSYGITDLFADIFKYYTSSVHVFFYEYGISLMIAIFGVIVMKYTLRLFKPNSG